MIHMCSTQTIHPILLPTAVHMRECHKELCRAGPATRGAGLSHSTHHSHSCPWSLGGEGCHPGHPSSQSWQTNSCRGREEEERREEEKEGKREGGREGIRI